MELIKLPISLGLMVAEILKNQNIELRKIESGTFKGMLTLEFSQEELDLVKELNIINPSSDSLSGIENLRCLESLSITTTGSTAYQNKPSSITDKDILKISKIKNLKKLKIDNQSKISWINLEKLENLEYIKITRNTSLEEVFGLNKLQNVKEFVEYSNKELFVLDGISELINQNKLDILELDFLHFDEIYESLDKLGNTSCQFSESIRTKDITIDYSPLKMLYFHKKCLEIATSAKRFSQDERTQIIYVENYIAKNITYDYNALENKKRAHYENGTYRGNDYGTNSAYNGIMYGAAVCEGYTRSMQYILKLMGIKSKNVHCISGANKISINNSYHNQVTLPDNGYHSIIRIDSHDSIYYCDPCWDSCRFHKGDTRLPYCLLTKKEMQQTHTLSFEENDVIYDIAYPRKYISNIIEQLQKEEISNLDEINPKKK